MISADPYRELKALSDRQGRFLFTGLSPGRYLIRAIAEGWIGSAEAKLLVGASAVVEVPVEATNPRRWRQSFDELESDAPPEIPIPEQTDDEEGVKELPGDEESEIPVPEQPTGEIDELPGDDQTTPGPKSSEPDIRFTYEGENYVVGADVYPQELILLPDKTLLKVRGWLETSPPRPSGLTEVSYTQNPKEPLRRAAQRLGATLASARKPPRG